MKGTLHKTKQGWVVNYHFSWIKNDWETLLLHPQDIKNLIDLYDNPIEGRLVEFEIVHFWENGEVGVNGLTYARLTQEEKPFIDNRKEKLETLAKILAKTWFYCDWKWESPNERVMQMLMQDLGLYPFKDEDEMIQQTKINDGLDDELYKEANRRIPTYKKSSKDSVENKPNLHKMEQKLDEALAKETTESMTEWMNDKRKDDIHFGDLRDVDVDSFCKGYNKAKETLYTKEDLKKAFMKGVSITGEGYNAEYCPNLDIEFENKANEYIQSLKQPKQ